MRQNEPFEHDPPLDPTFQHDPPKHERFFELRVFVRTIIVSLQNDAMLETPHCASAWCLTLI